MASGESETSKRTRSPSYPAIDLETAVGRARTFYDREKRHPAPVATALKHWGYTIKSSGGLVTVAALTKFGLLISEGSTQRRKVHLSDLALRILLDSREDSGERKKALQEAALKPTIHQQLWEEHDGSLPSDDNLRTNLLLERKFSETAVDDFIEEYKRTLVYAGLLGSGTLADTGSDMEEPLGGDVMGTAFDPIVSSPETPSEVKDFTFSVTLYGGRLATVKVPVPMTKRNLERLKRMIADQLEPFVDGDDPEAS